MANPQEGKKHCSIRTAASSSFPLLPATLTGDLLQNRCSDPEGLFSTFLPKFTLSSFPSVPPFSFLSFCFHHSSSACRFSHGMSESSAVIISATLGPSSWSFFSFPLCWHLPKWFYSVMPPSKRELRLSGTSEVPESHVSLYVPHSAMYPYMHHIQPCIPSLRKCCLSS